MYAFSKVAAQRLAIFVSTQKYFPKFFGVEPWWIAKFFHEETDAVNAFANVPELVGRYRMEGLQNLTTEGHYPEAWQLYSRMAPKEVKHLLSVVDASCGNVFAPLPAGEQSSYASFGTAFGQQERFSYLMLALLTRYCSSTKLLSLLESARENHLLSETFLGTSLSYRRIPDKWTYCFLKSQIQADGFPVWLTGWYGVRIEAAEYDAKQRIATIRMARGGKDSWIELGLEREPSKITLDGGNIPEAAVQRRGQFLLLRTDSGTTLQMQFP